MAFPQIGLRAVFEISGFQQNYSRYQTMMRDVDRSTQQAANKVNQATRKLTQDVARSFGDFARKSSIVQDAFNNLRPEAAIQEYQRLAQAFADLGDKAQVNVGVFDHLVNSGLSFTQAMQVAGGQINFNVEAFDRLINKGVDAEDAFQRIASGAGAAGESISFMGRSFSVTAVAVAAVTATLRVGYQIVRDSVEAYTELAEATRQVSLQTGLLTQEASGWVAVAQAAGLSTATSERAMTSFLSKVADLRRDIATGEELTSDFALAMQTLGISVTDSQGNLRTTEALLNDVNRAFQGLGPGIVSAQLATDLFGYSGRFLLPILVDQTKSLADMQAQAEDLGTTLTSLDRQGYEELRKANIRLQQALQGIKNEIARGWVPAITAAKNALADFINVFRQVDARLRAGSDLIDSLKQGYVGLAQIADYYSSRVDFYLGKESEAARAAEQAAQDRADAAQNAAAIVGKSEEQIQAEREKTLAQLDDLKGKLVQKLEDIERDAQRYWEDIYINRQRDAIDRAIQLSFRMEDLRQALNDRMRSIEEDFAKRWENILVKRQRDAIERAIREAQKLEDLVRQTEQRRQDLIRDYNEREVEQRRDLQRRIEEAERDARERREELEREHQKRLEDIRLDYLDTVEEAARQNDAVAVARAVRQRNRELRDEERRFSDEQAELSRSLQQKREEIERDRREREADQRAELERALQRVEENYQRQLEELARQRERERALRELQYQWELEDFNQAKREQIEAAQDWYDEQIADLEKSQERERILREIQYRRQLEDFNRNQRRLFEDARRWYETERNELAAHLNLTGQQLEFAYQVWMQQAAAAAQQAAAAVAAAWASEITRYQHLLPTGGAGQSNVGIIGGRGIGISMAEGGVIHASSPTTVVMGDAGPETGIFLPGRGGTMNVNHNFGQLGVNFGGLPGGVDTAQIKSIVYQTMIQLAKNVQVKKWR